MEENIRTKCFCECKGHFPISIMIAAALKKVIAMKLNERSNMSVKLK